MRISKLLSAVCAAAICAGVTALRAQDNPDQAAALAALKQKMSELDAQAGQTTNQSLAPVVVPPSGASPAAWRIAPRTSPKNITVAAVPGTNPTNWTVTAAGPTNMTVTPVPETTPPSVIWVTPSGVVPAPVPVSDNSDFFTPVPPPSNPGSVPALPRQQMPNPNSQPAFTTNPPSKLVKPPVESVKPSTPPVLKAPPRTKSPAATNAMQTPAAAQPPAKKAVEVNSSSKPAVTEVKQTKPAETVYPGKDLGFAPVEPPPPPVSAEQEAALHALLGRYMANEITPDQYQAERKKIRTGQ